MIQNGITYVTSPKSGEYPVYVVPSGAFMNRKMYYVQKVLRKLRTFASPRSTRQLICQALEATDIRGVVLNADLEYIGDACIEKSKVKVMYFPENKVGFRDFTMDSDKPLRVYFANGATSISTNALCDNNVVEVVIPASVRDISKDAF